MKPLYVSFRCLKYGKDSTGCCIIEYDKPVSTQDDIDELERKIIAQEAIQSNGLTIYFWRRVE